jgi:hypothetical protein
VRDNANLSSRVSLRARAPPTTTTSTTPSTLPGLPLARSLVVWAPVVTTSCAPAPWRRPQPHADRKAAAQRPRSFQPPRRPVFQRRAAVPASRERSASWHQRLLVRTSSPEDHQPSARATCRVLTTPRPAAAREMATGSQVSVYATNYNVLRIMSMGGLATRPGLPMATSGCSMPVAYISQHGIFGHLHFMGLT